ncbi:iron ABC transporter permease [Paucilactobacillus sp. N302-9]
MKRYKGVAYLSVAILLLITIIWSITAGASQQSLTQTWHTLLFGHHTNYFNTLINIRLPRIVATMICGAMLSIAGTFFQATLRNSVADPSILGIAAGADLFVLFATLLFPAMLGVKFVFGLLGGLIALGLLVQTHNQAHPYKIILIGVALNTMFLGIKQLFSQNALQSSGQSFATITWSSTIPVLILGSLGLMGALLLSGWANYLKIGDHQLKTIGLHANTIRLTLLLLAVYLTSSVSVVAGVLPFLGIITTHISRYFVGSDYREIVGFAIPLGAFLLLFIDTLGRTIIIPSEISAAAILAVIGGPALILILTKKGIYNGD